jgi:hypothetical protein
MIMTENVQHTMNDQQCQFVVDRTCVVGSLPRRDRGTDDHVAEQQRHVGRIRRRTIGAATGRLSVLHDLSLGSIDGKGQNVGRTGLAHVAVVELSHLALADEQDCQFGQAAHALVDQHIEGELLPTGEIDPEIGLLIGNEHLRNTIASDTLRTRQSRATIITHDGDALRSSARP